MKKIFTLLFTGLSVASAYAQSPISITSADMPKPGIVKVSNANPQGFNFTATGANHNWNFTGLTATTTTNHTATLPVLSPYGLFFLLQSSALSASAVEGPDSLDLYIAKVSNVWNYYRTTKDAYIAEGFGYTGKLLNLLPAPAASTYSDEDEVYQFPLEYGDVDNSTFSITTTFTGIGKVKQAGTRTTTVDGWGKITTPAGTFDCIRVKSVIKQIDSVNVTALGGVKLGLPANRTEYKWLTKGENVPVLEVIMAENFLGQSSVKEVRFLDEKRNNGLGGLILPIVNLLSSDTIAAVGLTEIKLFDQSLFGDSRTWEILGGTFSFLHGTSDTSKNPIILLHNAGIFTIKLNVRNLLGVVSRTLIIVAGALPDADFTASALTLEVNDTLTLTDVSKFLPSLWQWDIQPLNYQLLASTDLNQPLLKLRFTQPGLFSISLQVGNIFGKDSVTRSSFILVTKKSSAAGISQVDNTHMNTYPNPVSDRLNIIFDNELEMVKIRIFTTEGKLVNEQMFNNATRAAMDVNTLQPGVYIISAEVGGSTYNHKFIKQ